MKELEKLLELGKDIKISKVETVIENNKRLKLVWIQSKSKKKRCPDCHKFTSSLHDKLKPIKLKGLKIYEIETKLIVAKRRFICKNCNKKFTEDLNINEKNKTISNKVEQRILKQLKEYNLSLEYIAKDNNISDNSVRKILIKNVSYPKVRNLPKIISFDEFKADTKKGKYAFVLNDPIHKKCLDILPERKKESLLQYFTYCENRHSVEFVISDMYEPYLLVTKVMFPKAKYVVDRFHYIKYIMEALDNVRIRLQKIYGEKSKEYKLLKNKKNVSLLRKYSNDVEWWTYAKRYKNNHIIEILNFDIRKQLLETSIELKQGYYLKEAFLDIINHSSYEDSKSEILSWCDLCYESKIPEFIEAANTITNWIDYICNSFIDIKYSNGFTEGLNNKIKVVKRVGFGYKNFEFFRLRLLYVLNTKNSKKR